MFELQNIVKTKRLEQLDGQTYCKHISLAQPSEFDLHTPASFSEMVDILETAHRQEGWSNTRLEELGKACGINYDPDSIIFDKSLRSVINPIDSTYWDWMRGLVASGGVAQLEVNGFCHAIVHAGTSLESIDQFH